MEIKITNLSKSYKKFRALSHVNIRLTEGVYALLGPNGAGKSTLIRCITQLHPFDSGSILLDNKELPHDFLKMLGYLPQDPLLYSSYSAYEFLYYMGVIKGMDNNDLKREIPVLLDWVNLNDVGKKKIGTYSGGMRQRLGIAQALLNDPKLLILDEPTAGLDPKERLHFRNIISKLSKDRIILLATHIVSDIESIAKDVIVLDKGKVVAQSSPQELVDQVSPFVWKGMVNSEEELERIQTIHLISNLKVIGKKYELRVVSESKPFLNAENSEANLEDVYLYFFSGKL